MGFGDASLRGNVGKCSVAVVVIEDVGGASKIVGVTVGAQAGFLFSPIAVVPEAPIYITGHEEVEAAVVVVIEEPGARAPSAGGNSSALRDVGERAVPIVVVERVAAVACHADVLKTIVIVVAHRYTHRVVVLRHPSEAGFFPHIRECAVGVLIIKAVPKPAIGLVRELAIGHRIVDLPSVGEEDIQPPVVVIVEEGYASSHGFQQVLVGSCGVFVLEIDPRGPGDSGELHFRTGCGSDHSDESPNDTAQ